jgi:hypothetical protein
MGSLDQRPPLPTEVNSNRKTRPRAILLVTELTKRIVSENRKVSLPARRKSSSRWSSGLGQRRNEEVK